MSAREVIRYSWLYYTARIWARLFRVSVLNRRTNPYPVSCECGWFGRRRNCSHGWFKLDDEDGEPIDRCPKCGSEI